MIFSFEEKTENDFIKFENEKFSESYKYFCENIDKEEEKDINIILMELNKSIQLNLDYYYENNINKDCMELIFLLEKKGHKKNRKVNKKIKNGFFKPLKKPKIISMIGRVLSNN